MDVSSLFLHMDIQLSEDQILEIILFSLNVLGMLVKDQLMVTVSVCISVLKSVPLICLYMLHYFIHYNVAINFTGRLEFSNCLLFRYYYSPCESPGLTYEF